MKIYLYLNDRILNFSLPEEVEGSFSFDWNLEEENKLINIEAQNGNWVIYSTKHVKLISNNEVVSSKSIQSGSFYVLRRNDKNFLIGVNSVKESKVKFYTYDNQLNLIIGTGNWSNVRYLCPYLANSLIRIYYKDSHLILENKDRIMGVYVNHKAMLQTEYFLKIGDQINIYNLKLIFLKNLLLIGNGNETIEVIESNTHIKEYMIGNLEEIKNIEVEDEDLYQKEDYFSKAPRIRRFIETKVIKLSPPPKLENNQELPMILTIGPMMTMGIMSSVSLISVGKSLISGSTTIAEEWPGLVTSSLMIISIILWPVLTRAYNNKMQSKNSHEVVSKYKAYLDEKRQELETEKKNQRDIILENLISVDECLKIIQNRNMNFWDKRMEQNDFLVVRIGLGNALLDARIEYPEEGFTIEEDLLRKQADKIVDEFQYIDNVPISYSFYDNKVTAVMGNVQKSFYFVSNIILQLITFYSYEDLKLVVFTNDEKKEEWEYIKYLSHNFNNERTFRFFASNNESIKEVSEFLNIELSNRLSRNRSGQNNIQFKPHYFIVIDDYEKVKRHEFIKTLTELDSNIGFSVVILEDRLSKLPSKCNSFISLGNPKSGVLKNSYEKQEQITFVDEIRYDIDMMAVSKILANVPIEFEEGIKTLPESISFLEMERVGKVEQLNILNRWNMNDSTVSLKTEIGLDEQGDLMYLDLHEKYHGPHGLIAGTTGSGKSEFIITYILSMCINYSPDDIAFILIDYKGGGLALAFENKVTGISLPHLAGIITNLDKAEMDRTLVSIHSELQRRQQMFNQVRDRLDESTIDIYKYQRLYHEGKINEPVPHLFIICDEFAELKAQQPEFMDNLISVARIGRSLGVHLILATQKPSGVVNEQIWSNTKFRVCFKVQDESDSKEMLKRSEAASLKQAGRYYLQVGYDEYFALGQSAWCGTKYYPSDAIVKQVDKSVNVINDNGNFIKSIQATSGVKLEQKGEQLSAVLKYIMEVSSKVQKRTKRLWLDNIPEVILVDDLMKKYNVRSGESNIHVEVVIGEVDVPEEQRQDPLLYSYLKDGNTIIYGDDGSEKEHFLNTLIYSTVKNYSVNVVNYYIVDYGSESLRKYKNLPHVGGIVFAGEEEKYYNLFKMLREEIQRRKELFADYGGEYINYVKSNHDMIPLKVVIINNYDSVYESNPTIYDELPELVRDSERYGILFILTANATNSIQSKISSNFSNIYTFKLKDLSDYSIVLGSRAKTYPREIFGRGLFRDEDIHEFQTASILEDEDQLNEYLVSFIKNQREMNSNVAEMIPTLPSVVRLDDVESAISNLGNVPIGISKMELEVQTKDYLSNLGNIITSIKLENTKIFTKSLLQVLRRIPNNYVIILDPQEQLGLLKTEFPNYYTKNLDELLLKINDYLKELIEKQNGNQGVILVYGYARFISQVNDNQKITEFVNLIKKYENISLIAVDDYNKFKNYCFEGWFTSIFNLNNGIWVGRGLALQNLLRLSSMTKEMTKDYKNDMGYVIDDGVATLCKLVSFFDDDMEEKTDGK